MTRPLGIIRAITGLPLGGVGCPSSTLPAPGRLVAGLGGGQSPRGGRVLEPSSVASPPAGRAGCRKARMPSSAVGRPRSRVSCVRRALRRFPTRSGGTEAATIVRALVRFAGVEARRSFRGIVARPGVVRDAPPAGHLRVVRLAMARRPRRSGPGTCGRAIRRSYGSSRPMCWARPIASLREETPSFR
jgi:hypothetical protein